MRTTFDIMVDYDDVIYPWSKTAHNLCVAAGITNGQVMTQWDFWKDYGVPESVVWNTLRPAITSGELYGAPLNADAIKQINRLRNYGHRVHIVTARCGQDIEAFTRRQILERHVGLDSLTFATDKGEAAAFCHFAIDDGVHNYLALDHEGVRVYLLDAFHNQDAEVARRVRSVAQFTDTILAVANAFDGNANESEPEVMWTFDIASQQWHPEPLPA